MRSPLWTSFCMCDRIHVEVILMRLWHQSMLSIIPDNQLASQHRECCALRGKGWGKKHATVDYVFTHPIEMLIGYHFLVMNEMKNRGKWNPDQIWYNPQYRGKLLGLDPAIDKWSSLLYMLDPVIYPEHNEEYLIECKLNLFNKGHLQFKSSLL